jgi:hypothetical protein
MVLLLKKLHGEVVGQTKVVHEGVKERLLFFTNVSLPKNRENP